MLAACPGVDGLRPALALIAAGTSRWAGPLLTPQSVNAIVVHLERAGLLERCADARDQRLRRIYVSQAGREVLAAARPAVWAVEQRMVASMTAAEQATFRRQLTECALALDTRLASGPAPVHPALVGSRQSANQSEDSR